jgi:hypothetical protein
MVLPLALGGVCIVASVISTYFVRLDKTGSIMRALYKGLVVSGILSAGLIYKTIEKMVGFTTVYNVGGVETAAHTVKGKLVEATITGGINFTGTELFYCSLIGGIGMVKGRFCPDCKQNRMTHCNISGLLRMVDVKLPQASTKMNECEYVTVV